MKKLSDDDIKQLAGFFDLLMKCDVRNRKEGKYVNNNMPPHLKPTTTEALTLPSGKVIEVPKCVVSFDVWKGKPLQDTYGNKQVLDYKGAPLFAELLVRAMFKENNWDGVWVDSYRKCFRTKMPEKVKEVIELPEQPKQIYDKIVETTGFRGCWDVFLWNDSDVLFVECKRNKKDKMQESQLVWLETCLKFGLLPHNFLFVEWDVK